MQELVISILLTVVVIMAAATEMAYNILCLKTGTFEDGTVWNNPEYESWYQTYAGKEINVSNLTTYYPHVYTMYPQ